MNIGFPHQYEMVQEVVKKLLEDILPMYGFPTMTGSDNGLAFLSQVSQRLATFLGRDWKLHCTYRPQSSGQVERMSRNLRDPN